jgi:hypothetical protein
MEEAFEGSPDPYRAEPVMMMRLVSSCQSFGETYCSIFSPEDGDSMFILTRNGDFE